MTRVSAAALAAAAIAVAAPVAHGVTRTFTGGDTGLNTSWDTATNWNPAQVPQTGDDVVIPGISTNDTLVVFDYFGILSLNTLTLNHNNVFRDTATSTLSMGAFGLSVAAQYIGDTPPSGGSRGRGRFDLSGGTNTATLLVLGRDATTIGSYNLSGTGTLNTTNAFVGAAASGFFTQTGGTHNGTYVTLGEQVGSTGTYNLAGGFAGFTAAEEFTVGKFGSGTFNVSSGAQARQLSEFGFAILGDEQGSTGTATVSGAGSTWSNARLFVGSVGTGTLTINDGGTVASANTFVGFAGTGSGTVTVSGAGSRWTHTGGLRVGGTSGQGGSGGTGTLDIQSGGYVSSFFGFIGASPGSNGTVAVAGAGSTWAIEENLGIGPFGSGTLNVDPGATVRVAGSLVDSGVVRLRGGTIDAGTINADTGVFDWTAGTLHAGNFVGNLVNPGGTLAPGHSAGQTVVTGNYTQQPGGTLEVEIGGPGGIPSQSDFLGVSETAAFDGTLRIALINGFTPEAGDALRFTTYGAHSGTFATIDGYAIAPGLDLAVHYRATEAGIRAGRAHDPTLDGILDVPGTRFDVTGDVEWVGTFVKQGAGSMIVDLTDGSSVVRSGARLDVQAGNVILKSDVGTPSARLSIRLIGGDATFEATQRLGLLDIADGRTATMAAGGDRVLAATALEIDDSAALDLGDNDLIVDYAGASPEFQIRGWVLQGLTAGTGIVSLAGEGDTVLAVAEESEWAGTSFHGFSLDDTTIVGKYTYFGDANLDGRVTTDDYVAIDLGLGTGDSWVQGDFDLNGVVTTDDYVVVDLNLGKGTTNPLAYADEQAAMISLHTEMFGQSYLDKLAYAQEHGWVAASVPEPGALSVVSLGASGVLGRRRRTSSHR